MIYHISIFTFFLFIFLSFFFIFFYFFLLFSIFLYFFFFFFQAEDGIRDKLVTGVQTCALPISLLGIDRRLLWPRRDDPQRGFVLRDRSQCRRPLGNPGAALPLEVHRPRVRSEERRVGKSVDLGGRRIIKKKIKK